MCVCVCVLYVCIRTGSLFFCVRTFFSFFLVITPSNRLTSVNNHKAVKKRHDRSKPTCRSITQVRVIWNNRENYFRRLSLSHRYCCLLLFKTRRTHCSVSTKKVLQSIFQLHFKSTVQNTCFCWFQSGDYTACMLIITNLRGFNALPALLKKSYLIRLHV